MEKNLLIIDMNAIVCRYFFALKEDFHKTPQAFFSMLKRFIKDKYYIIACFDKCSNNFRKKIFTPYKQNRIKGNENLYIQLAILEQICKDIGIPVYSHDEYESDDLIGSICFQNKDYFTTIMTTDKDLYQLIDTQCVIYNPFTKQIIDRVKLYEKYELSPEDFALFLALTGDSSDNIPGIKNIGPKKALGLIKTYSNIANMIAIEQFDFSNLNLMIELTTIKTDIPIIFQLSEINEYYLNYLFNNLLN